MAANNELEALESIDTQAEIIKQLLAGHAPKEALAAEYERMRLLLSPNLLKRMTQALREQIGGVEFCPQCIERENKRKEAIEKKRIRKLEEHVSRCSG